MGAIFSRRKCPTTLEVLENLENEIQALEKLKKGNLEKQKRIIGSLVLYSMVVYFLAVAVFYMYFLPEKTAQRVLYTLPLLCFPPIIWLLKRFLHWYFVKRISKNDTALEDLKEQKKNILEEVMEKETYKKAKEILEKFDPEQHKKFQLAEETPTNSPQQPNSSTEVRQRQPQGGVAALPGQLRTPAGRGYPSGPPNTAARNGQRFPQGTPAGMVPPGPPMPRPILPRDRTTADRLIELLVGDGPQNRYALICRECQSHNGMAMKEEFEYLSFRCCYCYTLNPAKKERPRVPKLEFTSPTPQALSRQPDKTVDTTDEEPMETSTTKDTSEKKND